VICFCTAADLRAFKIGCNPIDLSCFTDAELNEALELALDVIQRLTNRNWCAVTERRCFDGSGEPKQFFRSVTTDKLSTVTLITVAGCGSTTPRTITTACVTPYYLDLTLAGCCGCGLDIWPEGCKNVCVTGTWGETVVPAAIRRAVKLLALDKLIPGGASGGSQCAGMPNNVKQASWPDFSVTFDTEDTASVDGTGLLEVDRLIALYANPFTNMFHVLGEKNASPSTRLCRGDC
jgi:hypothetical protein